MRENTEYESNLLMSKKTPPATATIVVSILFLIVVVVFIVGYVNMKAKSEQRIAELESEIERLSDPATIYEKASKEVNIDIINAEIQDIGELATLEYLYTDAGKFSDLKQLFGHDIPFTTKSFIAKWDGIIKAGIRIDKVTAEINDTTKEIIVHMPEAEILSHEIDDESIETLDEQDGLFNPIEIDDIREFDAISKDAMEKRAMENGILDKAYENAQDIIYKLINTDIVKELKYHIVFHPIAK